MYSHVDETFSHTWLWCIYFLDLRRDLAWLVVDQSLVLLWNLSFSHNDGYELQQSTQMKENCMEICLRLGSTPSLWVCCSSEHICWLWYD